MATGHKPLQDMTGRYRQLGSGCAGRPLLQASVSYGRKQAITAHNRAKQTTTGPLLSRDPGGRRRI